MGVVLGRGADQRRAADVDVFDAVVEAGTRRDRRLEGVEVDDHEVDGGDAVLGHGLEVRGLVPAREDTAMDARLQGLDAPVHDLGKARVR